MTPLTITPVARSLVNRPAWARRIIRQLGPDACHISEYRDYTRGYPSSVVHVVVGPVRREVVRADADLRTSVQDAIEAHVIRVEAAVWSALVEYRRRRFWVQVQTRRWRDSRMARKLEAELRTWPGRSESRP